MAIGPHIFKRVVLGLQPSAPDDAIRFAADLADLLHLELLGVFFEDTSLRDLASIPFARELRTLGGGWHPLDLDRLSRDLEAAARNMERAFTHATRQRTTRCQFEVVRGRTTETITALSAIGDIVAIMEPVSPAERATQQFSWLVKAAFQSAAAVMLLPTRIVRHSGPVVVIAAAPDDPGIRVAAGIAAAAREELVIVGTQGDVASDPHIRKLAEGTSVAIRSLAAVGMPSSDPTALLSSLRHLPERLVVLTRGVVDDAGALALTSALRVPVLVLEPVTKSGSAQ